MTRPVPRFALGRGCKSPVRVRPARWSVSLENLRGAQARRGLAFASMKARHTEGGTRCPYCGSTPSVTSIGWSPSR